MTGDDEVAFVIKTCPVRVGAEDWSGVAGGLSEEAVVCLVASGEEPDPGVNFDAVSFAEVNGGLQRIPSSNERVLFGRDAAVVDRVACVDGLDENGVDACGFEAIKDLCKSFG